MNIEIKAYDFDYGDDGWYELEGRLIGISAGSGVTDGSSSYRIRQVAPWIDKSCYLAEFNPPLNSIVLA